MAVSWTIEGLARAVAEEFAVAWGRRVNAPASLDAAEPPAGPGWLVSLAVSGTGSGSVRVWIDRASAVACARLTMAAAGDPDDAAVADLLRAVAIEMGTGLESRPALAGLVAGAVAVAAAEAPASMAAYGIAAPGGGTATIVTAADVAPSTAAHAADGRFDAVLDVDLPLIVRFGRAIMPLRALADLGPGSVIDMGRSPDDPVDLLVGQRLIARGEVVIVGGHYGVRITELMGNRSASELEARAS